MKLLLKRSLTQWAAENGLQLLEFEHRLNTGPFVGIAGKAQLYFEFAISDRRKKPHVGWAHFNYGLFGRGRFQVKWIEGSEPRSNKHLASKR